MQKIYKIKNLSCANCAAKFERALNEDERFNKASVNITTNKVIMDQKENACYKDDLQETIDKIESGVEVSCQDDCKYCSIHTKDDKKKNYFYIARYSIAFILVIFSLLVEHQVLGFSNRILYTTTYVIGYLLISFDIIINMLKAFKNKNFFDENTLMVIASIGAIILSDFIEAIAVMTFYKIGEYFQERAVEKSKKSIAETMDLRPETANLIEGNEVTIVKPESLQVGNIILIKPGEKVAVDGIVVSGSSSIDTKSLTGESLPIDIKVDDYVSSGVINLSNPIEVKVNKVLKDSTATKIIEFVENNNVNKAKTEKFITRFAKYYTPIVVILAFIFAFIPPIFTALYNNVSYFAELKIFAERAIVFLVISCPCALVLSVPLTFFSGIGKSSKKGVLFKSSSDLEKIKTIDTFIFDKTGTLTKGIFTVTSFINTGLYDDQIIKSYSKAIESKSNHPIAKSIVKYNENQKDVESIRDIKELFGKGMNAIIDNKEVALGNEKYLNDLGIKVDKITEIGTIIYVVIERKLAGWYIINDEIKETSKKTIDYLKQIGKEVIMVTGDNESSARDVAKKLGIENYYYSKMPLDKSSIIKNYQDAGKQVMFIGDGINDAPVLSIADLAISMGGIGSDVAVEASDVVLMHDEPEGLIFADKISKMTIKIAYQNIVFALLIKIVTMILGAIGIPNMMWIAVFADVGVSLLAVLNSIRVLYSKKII